MKSKYSAVFLCLINALIWCVISPLQIADTQQQQSDKTISKTCLEPKTTGLCRGKVLRYAYDEKSKRCVSFYYSGCGATHNNFRTYEECRRDCISQSRY